MNPANVLPTHLCLGSHGSPLCLWHSKSSPVPTAATHLHPSYCQGTEITERKCNQLLWFPLYVCGGGGGVKNSEPEHTDDCIIGYWWAPRAAATVCTERKISDGAWCQHRSALAVEGSILPVLGQALETITQQTQAGEVADLPNQEMPIAFLTGAIMLLRR